MSRTHFARAIQGLYPVHLARNADEAIEILEEHGADIAVLVTDFRMPVSNGDQLLREAAQRYPHIVRILVTAYADKDMLLRTVNTGGVFRIIEKPLRIETVRETLREAIAQWTERETRQHQLLAMDETLAFLAHELNTPLATIALIAQTIENGSAGESDPMSQSKVADAATSMLANAQYCMTLISSFWASIMRSFGGGLEIDSTLGVGTTVTMRFGTRKERAKATGTERPLEPQSSLDTPG
ncbi:response regulator [Paraburkholderia sp. CNPSo 3076]|nr:response regulator [Paraburkholderia sp. CNPSo 3076]